jgi:hypothetical protein
MDYKLKAKIVERYGTQRNFSKACGIPEYTLSNYLRGAWKWKPEHKEQVERCLPEAKELLPQDG